MRGALTAAPSRPGRADRERRAKMMRGGTGPDRRRSARRGHRRGDPGRLRPGRERAAAPRPDGTRAPARPRGRPASPVQSQSIRSGPLAVGPASWRAPGHREAPAPPDPADPEPPADDPGSESDRFVPVGLTIPFREGAVSGELYLMSFAHTGSGARFIAAWGIRTLSLEHRLGLQQDPEPGSVRPVHRHRRPRLARTSWTSRPPTAPSGPARSACAPPRRTASAGSTSPRRPARRCVLT